MKTFLKVNFGLMVAALGIATLLTLGGCTDPGPTNAELKAQLAQSQAQIAKQNEMNANIALVQGCKAQGMEEKTCETILTQMSSGKVQGSRTLADCEAQLGVGKCASMPMQQQVVGTGQQVSSSGFSGGEVFVAAAAAAAAAHFATQWANNRNAPAGAALPRPDWASSHPVVTAPPNPGAAAAAMNAQKSLKSPSVSSYADMNKGKADYKQSAVNVKGVSGVDPTKFSVPPSTAKSAAVVNPPAAATTSKFSQSVPSSGYASKSSGSSYSSSYKMSAPSTSSRSSSSSSSSSSRSSSLSRR